MDIERIIKTLEWLIMDAKWRQDQLDVFSENIVVRAYSEELTEAINLLEELKGQKNGNN